MGHCGRETCAKSDIRATVSAMIERIERESEIAATPTRTDAAQNRERILEAAARLLQHSPTTTLAEIAAAAGVSPARRAPGPRSP